MRVRKIALSGLLGFVIAGSALASTVLHRPSDAEPDTLDPQKTSSAESVGLDRELFVGLVTLDPELKPVPGVAERWDVSADGKIWTFHLRPTAKWSNGEPLTASDFVYSFQRLADPKTAAADVSDIEQLVNAKAIEAGKITDLSKLGVVATDAHTLTITLSDPSSTFLLLMTDPQVLPVNRDCLEKWGNSWTQPGHIVSNGAYMMESWTPQSSIVLKKSPTFYAADTVKIDEVDWLDASDLDAALRRFRGGELDWTRLTPPGVRWAKQNMADKLLSVPTDANYFMFFNMTNGILASDIRLRQAINLAVNREVLVDKIDVRGEQPAYGIVPPVVPNYTPQSLPFKATAMADRIAQAKQLVAAAGYGPDHPLQLSVSYATSENTRQLLSAIREMLLPIGIDLTLDNMEWQALMGQVNQHNYQIGFMGTLTSYVDFQKSVEDYWSKAGIYNFTGWSNPAFDTLYESAMTALDEAKRRAMIEAAERIILADEPVVPLEYDQNNFVVAPKLVGFLGNVRFPQSRYLSFKDSAS
jgi:oligopeptide transport system substrate-binding protein